MYALTCLPHSFAWLKGANGAQIDNLNSDASMGHIHDVEPNHSMGLDWDIKLDRMVTTTFQMFDQLHTSNMGNQPIIEHMDASIRPSVHASGEKNPLDNGLPNLEPEQENYEIIMAKMFKEARISLQRMSH